MISYAIITADLLCCQGIDAEMFNRFKLGRTVDEAYAYGYNQWFEELALPICAPEGFDLRCNHPDTTSFSLMGEYVPDSAEDAIDEDGIHMTHGSWKDHQPDLPRARLAWMVSQNSAVPFVHQSRDRNIADTQVFRKRAATLMSACKDTPSPRYLVPDGKVCCEDKLSAWQGLA